MELKDFKFYDSDFYSNGVIREEDDGALLMQDVARAANRILFKRLENLVSLCLDYHDDGDDNYATKQFQKLHAELVEANR